MQQSVKLGLLFWQVAVNLQDPFRGKETEGSVSQTFISRCHSSGTLTELSGTFWEPRHPSPTHGPRDLHMNGTVVALSPLVSNQYAVLYPEQCFLASRDLLIGMEYMEQE